MAAVPRATTTALPTGMPTRAFCTVLVTTDSMSTFGAVGGNGERTAANDPSTRGVMRPQSDVKSATWFVPGGLLISVSVRRGPFPRQVPRKPILRTSSVPSSVTPALDRPGFGGVTSTPSRITMPLGRPSASVKKSPLTPTDVAVDERRFCIEETDSRPSTDSLESTGRMR